LIVHYFLNFKIRCYCHSLCSSKIQITQRRTISEGTVQHLWRD